MKSDLYVISGATGMTGSELTLQLLGKGQKIIAFDNFFASDIHSLDRVIQNQNLKFFNYDLNNFGQMQKLKEFIQSFQKDCGELIFINCAAVVHTEHFYEIDHTFQTNVLGMKSFLDMAVDCRADVFINCSTSEVYSMQSFKDGGVKEDDFLSMSTAEHSQRTSYAAGKLITEFFLKDAVMKQKINGCSIRFANVYSNYELYPKHIIPHIFISLLKEKKVTLLDNAKTTYRTFLHNYDSCTGVLQLCGHPTALDGSVYNIATLEEISIPELVNKIAGKLNVVDYKIDYIGERKSDPPRRLLNIDKITTKTNWRAVVDLDKGLDMCVETYAGKGGNLL